MEKSSRPPIDSWQRPGLLLLVIAYFGFISLGLPDAVAGVAWPSVRESFGLTQASFGWVFLAVGCGYFFSSFFAGRLTALLGLGPLLTVSSLLVGLSMLGNAVTPWWFLFVLAGMLWGLGSGAIDAGLNGFVASHFPARHVSWLHACYSTGATLGPLVMTAAIVQASSWRLGYAVVGTTMLAMTVLFFVTQQYWADGVGAEQSEPLQPAAMREVLRSPLVWTQAAVFFLYTGLESTAGQWSYTLLTESRNVPPETAGVWVALYYGAIAAGRVGFGFIAERVGLDRLVRLSTIGAVVGAGLFAFGGPIPAAAGLILLGLALASIFPTLMTRTPQRLGRAFAAHAIGFQVSAAMLGSATLPSLTGVAAEHWGLEMIGRSDLLIALAIFGMHELLLYSSRSKP